MGAGAAIAVIVFLAALVVLGAVAASGFGPLSSLRRSIAGFDEVAQGTQRLRRSVEVLQQRRERLGRMMPPVD